MSVEAWVLEPLAAPWAAMQAVDHLELLVHHPMGSLGAFGCHQLQGLQLELLLGCYLHRLLLL